jgi:hypothetical protein
MPVRYHGAGHGPLIILMTFAATANSGVRGHTLYNEGIYRDAGSASLSGVCMVAPVPERLT